MAILTKLTPRQKLFIQHYLKCRNGAKSARLAGYAESSADVEASRLLGNVSIKAIIAEGLAEQERKIELSADFVLRKLKELAEDSTRDSVKASALKMLGDHFGIFESKNGGNNPDRQDSEKAVSSALSELEEAE